MSVQRPLIGIPADRRPLGPQAYHLVAEKYLAAVLDAAGALPVIVPAIGRELELDDLLESLHGLLFMGSPSNVDPRHYSGEPSESGTLHDPHRDETTLPLIPKAVAAGVPVLGICRGFQEMNVAFGGTLWQKLHDVPGHLDHREPSDQPIDKQYGLAHAVRLEPGGLLQKLAGGATEITVNSLHPMVSLKPSVCCGPRALHWQCSGTLSGGCWKMIFRARCLLNLDWLAASA